MLRISFFISLLLILNPVYAVDFKGKSMIIASFIKDKVSIAQFKTNFLFVGMSAEYADVPGWKIDDYLENKLILSTESTLHVKAKPVTDRTKLPGELKFGAFGPEDDNKISAIANSDFDADFLLLIYPEEFSRMNNLSMKGPGFDTSNIGLFRTFITVNAVLFDLNANKMLDYQEIQDFKMIDFTREPIKEEKDAIVKKHLSDNIKPDSKELILQKLYASPFDRKTFIAAYKSGLDAEIDLEDELISDLENDIYYATTSINTYILKYKPDEQQDLKDKLYKILDLAATLTAKTFDPATQEEEF
jgi:hypothetical protein